MDTPAPNFEGNYPLAGERIGPAWIKIWQVIQPGAWYFGPDIAHDLAEGLGVEPRTIKNLLYAATQAGILESKLVNRKFNKVYRRTACYRVARKNLNA